jgi:hypothetical protein
MQRNFPHYPLLLKIVSIFFAKVTVLVDVLEIPEFKAVEENLQTAIKMCQRNTDNETLTDAEVHVSVV